MQNYEKKFDKDIQHEPQELLNENTLPDSDRVQIYFEDLSYTVKIKDKSASKSKFTSFKSNTIDKPIVRGISGVYFAFVLYLINYLIVLWLVFQTGEVHGNYGGFRGW